MKFLLDILIVIAWAFISYWIGLYLFNHAAVFFGVTFAGIWIVGYKYFNYDD